MAKIYTSAAQLIGHTPLLELRSLSCSLKTSARILAKLECFNPAGSVKDRVAKAMVEDAEARGLLRQGSVIIEPTSGNTGIGLASVAVAKGYRVILVMPDTMSSERRALLSAYGAELVLTDGSLDMQGAIDKAHQLASTIPNSYIPGQFTNQVNPAAHFATTGPEIWEDTDGEVDAFVAGVGTGGTLTGVGRFLKSRSSDVRIVAVEPASSAVLSGKPAGSHGLQGIGAGFVPETLDSNLIDEILIVTEEQAYASARLLATAEGILVGISSGAALSAAIHLARRPEMEGKTIVVLLPDGGDRYISTALFG